MAHRGPDGEGLWELPRVRATAGNAQVRTTPGQVILAHRRLAVVDRTPEAGQPFVDPLGRGALVYNGELYNDQELRSELGTLGWTFRTRSDTETILAALIEWGPTALGRLRGMYAIGFCDLVRGRVLVARDPLGVKPLYWWLGAMVGDTPAQLAFASEIRPLLMHPLIPTRPDFVAVHAYLTTIRTTLGRRTLFESVRTLLPGEAIDFDLTRPDLAAQRLDFSPKVSLAGRENDRGESAGIVREVIHDTVTRHLRADVSTCALLSGGLDSSIIASIAAKADPGLSTFCSGARAPETHKPADDFGFAALVASYLGTAHHEAPITRELFRTRWPEMIEATGLPLSTPNEVAINEVARLLRSRGNVVALSGEGADELFGGYSIPLAAAHAFLASKGRDAIAMTIEESAWIPPSAMSAVLRDGAWGADAYQHLHEWYRAELGLLAETSGSDPLEPHLRLLRRINLDGLLRRLDSATMLAGVEGRTPFADVAVATLAESLPMREKFRFDQAGHHGTKLVLRAAFLDQLPPEIVTRDKASFPLPFQEWIADHVGELTKSPLAQDLFSEAAIVMSTSRPSEAWRFAWPMINVAMWGKRWWGP